MHQLALNQVYIGPDGRAWYIEAPDEECSVCDLIRNAAETLGVELPILSDEGLSDLLTDWLQYGAEEPEGVLAILYRALCAMAEIRARLATYEDTGLEPEEILNPVEMASMACALQKLKRYETLGTVEELTALIKPEPNAPLTLEELREMDGEPMWVVPLVQTHEHEDMKPRWAIVRAVHFRSGSDGDGYGNLWVAYRRRPEEGMQRGN